MQQSVFRHIISSLTWLFGSTGYAWDAYAVLVICRVNLLKTTTAHKACCWTLTWPVVFQRHGHAYYLR